MGKVVVSSSIQKTLAAGKKFAQKLKPGSVVALEGSLGSGKTAFIKGIALGLGLKDPDEVTSPTFTLMHVYPTRPVLYHFDLYRLETKKEILDIGFEEFVNDSRAITCIEWARKAEAFLPPGTLHVRMQIAGSRSRRIRLP